MHVSCGTVGPDKNQPIPRLVFYVARRTGVGVALLDEPLVRCAQATLVKGFMVAERSWRIRGSS